MVKNDRVVGLGGALATRSFVFWLNERSDFLVASSHVNRH